MDDKSSVAVVELNEKQNLFLDEYLSNGGNGGDAYKAAGYSGKDHSSQASRIMSLPHVRQALKDKALVLLNTRLVAKAVVALDDLLDSKADDVRLRTAEAVLSRAGIGTKDQSPKQKGDVVIHLDFTRPSDRSESAKTIDGTHTGK